MMTIARVAGHQITQLNPLLLQSSCRQLQIKTANSIANEALQGSFRNSMASFRFYDDWISMRAENLMERTKSASLA